MLHNIYKVIKWLSLAVCCINSPIYAGADKAPLQYCKVKKSKTQLHSKDFPKFKQWLLLKKPSLQKTALIHTTLLNVHYPSTKSIDWFKISCSKKAFHALLTHTYPSSVVKISHDPNFFSYSASQQFWVDFANGYTFGGGFRTHGNTQEERMFFEFPQLAQLAYGLRNNNAILPLTKKDAEPFLIPNMCRRFDVSKVPYGRHLDKASGMVVTGAVRKTTSRSIYAHIIGIVAQNRKNMRRQPYSYEDLQFHLKQALLGNLAALSYHIRHQKQIPCVIHTGAWGAGAFKNSLKMMTAIQILAAKMAMHTPNKKIKTAQLIFHGINPKLLSLLEQEIDRDLKGGKRPKDILKKWVGYQKSDSSWKPKS